MIEEMKGARTGTSHKSNFTAVPWAHAAPNAANGEIGPDL